MQLRPDSLLLPAVRIGAARDYYAISAFFLESTSEPTAFRCLSKFYYMS